jgi:hypothetical protein
MTSLKIFQVPFNHCNSPHHSHRPTNWEGGSWGGAENAVEPGAHKAALDGDAGE